MTDPGNAPPPYRPEVLLPLSALLLATFVSIFANNVVATSLPLIVAQLGGGQNALNWIFLAMLLAMTVSTPLWGKLADLADRKLLIQAALGIFIAGSLAAGLAQGTGMLIAARVVLGVGAGGLMSLSMIMLDDILSPRERGQYMGLFAVVMAIGTVGGPVLGGVITDTAGWRWNFVVPIPLALLAIFWLRRTLVLPPRPPREFRLDYPGAVLLAAGVSMLLFWSSQVGDRFEWSSAESFWLAGGGLVLLVALVIVELRAREPILPLSLFRNRTFTLSVLASAPTGVVLFGTAVFLSQYMQLARGATPTESGIMTLPLMGGLIVASTLVGRAITRTGRWKRFLVGGAIAQLIGMYLLGWVAHDTPYILLALYMLALGAGAGTLMQNLVLIVQNTAERRHIGVASAGITFFRSLGGTLGVAVMGSVLGSRSAALIGERAGEILAAAQTSDGGQAVDSLLAGTLPLLADLPPAVQPIVADAFGQAVAGAFLVGAPMAAAAAVAVVLLPNVALRSGQRGAQPEVEPPGAPAGQAARMASRGSG